MTVLQEVMSEDGEPQRDNLKNKFFFTQRLHNTAATKTLLYTTLVFLH